MTSALDQSVAIVTGASRGLGRAIAIAFARAGAHVALVGRDTAALDSSVREARAACMNAARQIDAFASDVTDHARMAQIVHEWAERAGPVTILVNNAGILGPVGPFDEVDWADWTETIAVNLLAPVQLCRLVLPAMRQARTGKIINVSGGGATAPRPRFSAYATAKSALVRFTETLASELVGTGIDVNAIAPGAMNTAMLDELLEAGSARAGAEYDRAAVQSREGGVPPETAAALAVFLASRASDGISGRLLSAIWDPWEELAARRVELEKSDIYTLRRIVPADRGLDWTKR